MGVFVDGGMWVLVIVQKYWLSTGTMSDVIGLRFVRTWEYAQQCIGHGAQAATEHALWGEEGPSSSELVNALVGDEHLP